MSTLETLQPILQEAEELSIVCHNNPDPDCLASAPALGRIAAAIGIHERHILYSGDISHQQNRAFVNLPEFDLKPFDPATVRDRPAGSLLAFVDHSIPGVNNEVPDGTPVDIVIDHHPAEGIEARFVDHREESGATATILTEYVRESDLALDPTLATALLFVIRRETLGFLRGVTGEEYAAAGFLHEHADRDLLRRLATPSVTGATIDAIADAIDNRTLRGSVLISHVGRTRERDALPQADDYLATLEGVETAVVFGLIEDGIQLSARSTDTRVHIGDVLQEAFADVGSAGGHREMAGGGPAGRVRRVHRGRQAAPPRGPGHYRPARRRAEPHRCADADARRCRGYPRGVIRAPASRWISSRRSSTHMGGASG
jgi:nanoRNase/pAp phosphatase (c-di-AMP/oligoRNAs hydrolase)